jgi:uncharacterized RDD family membrane protein YckC
MSDHPPYAAQPYYPQPYQQYSQYPQHPQHPPVPVAPDGRPLAGLGRRFGARLIDGLVLLVATLVVVGVIVAGLAALLNPVLDEDSPLVPILMISAVVLLVLGLHYLYEVELVLRWNGQTPGKRALKIAVSALEPNVPLSRPKLAYRLVVMLAFNLLSNCYVGFLDPLWCLWDKPYRQCLHDKPAKTVVIQVQQPGSLR